MNTKLPITNQSIVLVCACAIVLTSPTFATTQNSGRDTLAFRRMQLEVPDDKYVPSSHKGRQTSPAYHISSQGFFATQVNVDEFGNNILGDAANEPSIAVDPTNPNRMAIGWRQFNTVTNNFRQAGYAYTTDGGHTWTFPGVLDPGIFRSDPVFDSDAEGNFYYNSLTVAGSDYSCNVFKSSDGGAAWDGGTFAQGGDKQWMIIDKTASLGEGNIYASWNASFSICPPGSFTRSTDRNASYESCVETPEDPFWGTLAVGNAGELYLCGVGFTDFVVAKSTSARHANQTVSWDTISVASLDGTPVAFAGSESPNPGGLHGQAWVAVDHSNGPSRGNVYLLCSVQRISVSDPLDVMFARSTDGGATWSAPVRVNDDPGAEAWQWFGTMSVAPTGRIDVVWLDTRDNPGSINSSLYYSYSTNAGVTWSENARLSEAFDPHVGWPQQEKMGDYFHMVSDSAGADLAWAGTFNGEEDVYYGRITSPLVEVGGQNGKAPVSFSLSQNYPNPFNPSTTVSYIIPHSSFVTLKVFDLLGREIATLVSDKLNAGTHTTRWDATGSPSGVYFFRLVAGEFTQTKKMVLVR
jgi:hypothetical protein